MNHDYLIDFSRTASYPIEHRSHEIFIARPFLSAWSYRESRRKWRPVSANDGIIGRKISCPLKWTDKTATFQNLAHADLWFQFWQCRCIVTGGFDKVSSTVNAVDSGCWAESTRFRFGSVFLKNFCPRSGIFFRDNALSIPVGGWDMSLYHAGLHYFPSP